MPAPITLFVDVNTTLAGAFASKVNFGALMGVFEQTLNVDRINGPFFSVADLNSAGFTSAAEPEVNAWGSRVFDQDDGVDFIEIGTKAPGDATYTIALDAIELAVNDDTDWYITNIQSRADADLAAASAWVEARRKIGIWQSADLAATAFLAMQASSLQRSAGIYHLTDAEYLDGAWSSSGGGLNLDAPDGAGIWGYRELEGVPFDNLTPAQVAVLTGADANYFGRLKSLNFTADGTMASGRHIDITTSIDWIEARIEEAILSLFVGTPTKIPFTNAGINILANAVQGILDQGVRNGHLSPDDPPRVITPDVRTISDADKAARVLTLQAQGTLSGAIQKLIVNINLKL